jgi:hypothetical protein
MSKKIKELPTQFGGIYSYYELERNVSDGFNRLKGKIYNLIEATITDKEQQKAIVGLIKGFANDEYKLCISNMKYTARLMKILDDELDNSSASLTELAEPLEIN